ncbi:hypothetical protein RRG08_042443 [Elysia crispata]|uniref:Uncharacterized protein n=1 Tax=Elysia crispata TaxID=231223 RepID=A0AAE1DE79_9GAST|nr:hypothetical protein RRG08_042443 [Elysia crispata]
MISKATRNIPLLVPLWKDFHVYQYAVTRYTREFHAPLLQVLKASSSTRFSHIFLADLQQQLAAHFEIQEIEVTVFWTSLLVTGSDCAIDVVAGCGRRSPHHWETLTLFLGKTSPLE